jgi:hypothetical protein
MIVTVVAVRGDRVRLRFENLADVPVRRGEPLRASEATTSVERETAAGWLIAAAQNTEINRAVK